MPSPVNEVGNRTSNHDGLYQYLPSKSAKQICTMGLISRYFDRHAVRVEQRSLENTGSSSLSSTYTIRSSRSGVHCPLSSPCASHGGGPARGPIVPSPRSGLANGLKAEYNPDPNCPNSSVRLRGRQSTSAKRRIQSHNAVFLPLLSVLCTYCHVLHDLRLPDTVRTAQNRDFQCWALPRTYRTWIYASSRIEIRPTAGRM